MDENTPGADGRWHIGCEGSVTWEGTRAYIQSAYGDADTEPVRIVSKPVVIRVRFNTEWRRSPPDHMWRVLVSGSGIDAEERLARHVVFGERLTDRFLSMHTRFESIGDKWHIGCMGQILWVGNDVYIVPEEINPRIRA